MIFLRAHQLLSEHNHQCVMALTPNSSPVLVTPDSCSGNSAALPALLLERITHLMESQASMQQQAAGARLLVIVSCVGQHKVASRCAGSMFCQFCSRHVMCAWHAFPGACGRSMLPVWRCCPVVTCNRAISTHVLLLTTLTHIRRFVLLHNMLPAQVTQPSSSQASRRWLSQQGYPVHSATCIGTQRATAPTHGAKPSPAC